MTKKFNEENKDLDKGWAWVVLFAATGTYVMIGIFIYCAGILHVALLERFDEDNAYTSFIGSIFTSLLSLGGLLASILINRFSCRTALIVGGVTLFVGFSSSYFAASSLNSLLLTYGIIAGTGLSLSTIPAVVVAGYFFHKYHGMAIGIITSGASIGMFIAGPLIHSLLIEYGLEGTYLILAALGSNIIVMGALIRPSELEFKHKKDSKIKNSVDERSENNTSLKNKMRNILHLDIFLDKTFIFCCLQFSLWNMAYSILLLHLPAFSLNQGSDKKSSAFLITYIGIGSTIGRILTGLSISKNGLDPVLLNFGLNGIVGFLTILFPNYSHIAAGRIIYSFLFGLYSGGLSTMINPLCMELLGVAKVSSGVGIIFFACGIGYLIGPPISGLIVDEGGTFKDSFYLCGVLFLLAAIFTSVSTIWRQPIIIEKVLSQEKLQNQTNVIHSSSLLNGLTIIVGKDDKDIFPHSPAFSDHAENHLCTGVDLKISEQIPLQYDVD